MALFRVSDIDAAETVYPFGCFAAVLGVAAGGEYFSSLLAQAIKYFMFDRSS